MAAIKIKLEKKELEIKKGASGLDILKDNPHDGAIAMKLDGKLVDLTTTLDKSAAIEFVTSKDDEGKEVIKHSAAHIMAQAIKKLYPEAEPTIGPAIDTGFYYDFDNLKIQQEDLPKIEKEMKKIIHDKLPFTRKVVPLKEALEMFKNKYKKEIIKELTDKDVSTYKQGDFVDLCRGPHVPHTGYVKAIKLTKLAGAYWRGDSNNVMLTRVYGVAFASKDELNEYVKLLEEAEKRDHKKIGKQMDLFSFHEEAAGVPFFHPKGSIIYNELLNFIRDEYFKRDYGEVVTPTILKNTMWKQSGHWDHYREDMYFTKIDKQDYGLKPMNCPAAILIYKNSTKSYRQLPLRYADCGFIHRNELSGVLNGLFRVRRFIQDDCHHFVTPDQMGEEIKELIDFVKYVYKDVFDFEFHVELSTKPDKAMGDDKLWEQAEGALGLAMKEVKLPFTINPGDGAFYGPKLDFHIKDALGRSWQCGTIQVDFQMPERFDLNYEGPDGTKHRPVIIHRTIIGSVERFMGVLLEHTAGRLPLWLSPVQVRIMPIADRHLDYAKGVLEELKKQGVRVDMDDRTETIGKKVRDAQLHKVPIMLTLGDKELEAKTLAARTLDGKLKFGIKTADFVNAVKQNIEEKKVSVSF
ncbi:MAG: threonine--tRNA ligase [Nanoarchaeota archaeon]|nr:threonine--tRNA ligase [Nanoarchaeota archaeon]